MATVYLAIQESFERKVALKVMSPSLSKDPSFGDRFTREARIVSHLVHPNIVTVYDVGVHNNFHFLSMEYVPGDDLKQIRFDLSLEQQLQVVKDIARALDYAGRKGYVHRDVKPENIMIHKEDGRAVLMDFGIARATDVASGMTQTGTTMGTPHYMSPEQAKGAQVDPRCDLYSLGVVLFQLITGHVPFDADSAVAVGIMHVSEAIPRLPAHLQLFQFIIDRVLAKRPEERYQRGNEFIADIETITPAQIADVRKSMDTVLHIDTVDVDAATIVSAAVTDKSATKINTPKAAKSKAFNINTNDGIGDQRDDFEEDGSGSGWIWAGVVVLMVAGGGYWWKTLPPEDNALHAPVTEAVEVITQSVDDAVGGVVTSLSSVDAADEASSVLSASSIAANDQSDLTSRSQALFAKLPADLSVVTELASVYSAMQKSTFIGEQQAAIVEQEALVRLLESEFNDAFSSDNAQRATTIAELLRSHLPDVSRDERFAQRLEASREQMWLSERLAQAQSYVKADALQSPEGANALAVYQEVLERYPNQADALTGIASIVTRYQQLAEGQLRANNLVQATTLIRFGLKLAPEDKSLLALQSKLKAKKARVAQQEKQQQLRLNEANGYLSAGQLLAPKNANAYDGYSKILQSDKSNTKARDGLVQVERALARKVESLLNTNTFDDAALLLAGAQDRFPQSPSLLALQIQLDELIESQKPAIATVLVSGQEMLDLLSPQKSVIEADRTIYIGFTYSNFVGEASVVQAALMDGTRNLTIAQTSIIVNKHEGDKFFQIERPVQGFPDGIYHVDLLLADKRLATVEFSVKSAVNSGNDATL